jgi:hypothetical protein
MSSVLCTLINDAFCHLTHFVLTKLGRTVRKNNKTLETEISSGKNSFPLSKEGDCVFSEK